MDIFIDITLLGVLLEQPITVIGLQWPVVKSGIRRISSTPYNRFKSSIHEVREFKPMILRSTKKNPAKWPGSSFFC